MDVLLGVLLKVSSFVVFLALIVFVVNIKVDNYVINSFKTCLFGLSLKKRVFFATIAPFTILLLPVLLLNILLFWIFGKTLEVYLRFKYGSNFGGFVKNGDAWFNYDSISKPIILCCVIAEFDGTFDEFFLKVRKRLQERCFGGKYQKMTATKKKLLGYTFLVENQVNVDDCLVVYDSADEVVDQKVLQRIFGENANRSLPKNDQGYWEVVVINKPIQWSTKMDDNDNGKKYCVLLRLHHSLCDGISAHKIIVGCLSDEDPQETLEEQQPQKDIWTELSKFYTIITTWCLLLPISTFLHFITTLEKFPRKATGRKICSWSIEETPKYIPKVKAIKKSLRGISFSEIIMAAVSASFFENYLQESSPDTDFVNILISGMRFLTKFPRYHHNLKDTYELNNDLTSYSFVYFPTFSGQHLSRLQKLKEFHKRYDSIRRSLISETIYWSAVISSLIFPNYIIKKILEKNRSSVLLSNVPGLQNMDAFDGCRVVEVFGLSPNYCDMNLSVCINSYDGRLQIGLIGDERLIADEVQGEKILNGVFKFFDELSEELGLER